MRPIGNHTEGSEMGRVETAIGFVLKNTLCEGRKVTEGQSKSHLGKENSPGEH